MEVDLPRLRTLEPNWGWETGDIRDEKTNVTVKRTWPRKVPDSPQMNEVAQRASVAEGLPVVLIVHVAADGDREGPLA